MIDPAPTTVLSPHLTEGEARVRLPVRTDDVFRGLDRDTTWKHEKAHGNRDLMELIDALGIAGPFRTLSPWELEDVDGRHLIHAGGYAAVPFGESYPPLIETVQRFLRESRDLGLPQQSLSAWRAAVEANLVAVLRAVAPSHERSRVFFSNSGAEAVEAAIKFVRAHRPNGVLINFSRAYHGKTAGALALTPNEEYQSPFRPLFGPVRTLPYGDLVAFEDALRELGPDKVSAVVIEPIQGEGGVVRPPAGYLAALGERCREHGILVVADEIQTGLGRSGHWFASVADGLDPDVITLAKPLGGGLVAVGATIARENVYKSMLPGVESKRHSNTFGGNSLAMAVALRSLELIHDEGLVAKARRDGEVGLARLQAIRDRFPDLIAEVRSAGMLFALQVREVAPSRFLPVDAELVHLVGAALALRALHLQGVHGCYSTNAQRVFRLTPALNLPEDLRDTMFDRVEAMAVAHPQAWKLIGTMSPARWMRLARLAL
jgi:acetylornithine/succinyldiaminopimelate/putrescine aminotransferase